MATRDRLIGYLKGSQGQWISGGWLSQQLGVSRAAVNKHIRQLREAGYPITSATRNGYRLEGVPDLLEAAEIRNCLDAPCLGQGEIHCLRVTDSTNLQAKILAQKGAPEGTLVLAEHQTHGRGRKGRSWCSPLSGGIYLSIILRPAIPPLEAPSITLVAGLSAAEALVHLTGLPARIKWPNDILVDGRKIAGILSEISTEADSVNYAVVGIGINVNTPAEALPPEVRCLATSIQMKSGQPFRRVSLVREFIKRFDRDYTCLTEKGFSALRQRWKAMTDIIGRRVQVTMIGRIRTGTVNDVDEAGLLILEDEAGDRHRVISGDVTFI